jgi:protein-tyrosine phosphatase
MNAGMIDLHSHILPGIDDGAPDLETSLEMARLWVADGVSILACTPHILPGLYHNSGPGIREAVHQLQGALDENNIPLTLVTGADNHVIPEFVAGLRSGHLLSLADTRYVLVEPPHHTAPPRLEDLIFSIMAGGYTPILTHPERLTWIKTHYDTIRRLAHRGVWMQITAGSLTGSFGRAPKYWGERMLAEGMVHIIATDAHDLSRRPPILSQGYRCAEGIVGATEAGRLVYDRPLAVLQNQPPTSVVAPEPLEAAVRKAYENTTPRGVSSGARKPPRNQAPAPGARGLSDWLQQFFS